MTKLLSYGFILAIALDVIFIAIAPLQPDQGQCLQSHIREERIQISNWWSDWGTYSSMPAFRTDKIIVCTDWEFPGGRPKSSQN